MRIKVYHGTTEEAAERIAAEGFRLPRESGEWFEGRGVYFSSDPDRARVHGPVVLETEIDLDDFEELPMGYALGTFDQFYESRQEFGLTEEEAWKEYLEMAEELRLEAIAGGKKGWTRGELGSGRPRAPGYEPGWMEVVVADPDYARSMKVRRTDVVGLPKWRTVVMRRPVDVQRYGRRA